MKKTLLLMTVMAASAGIANAQVKAQAQVSQPDLQMGVAVKAAPAVVATEHDMVGGPMYNADNGNYYQRDFGTYYVNVSYTVTENGEQVSKTGLWLVTAPFNTIKFTSMAADKSKVKWMCWNRTQGNMVDLSAQVNADGDFVLTPAKGYHASLYYMPITQLDETGTDTFYLGRTIGYPDFCYVVGYDTIGGLNYSLTDNSTAYGYFSGFGAGVKGSFFGSNQGTSTIGDPVKMFQYYPKPVKPMVVHKIKWGGWSFNRYDGENVLPPFADDGQLVVSVIRGHDPNGTDTIAKMIVNNDNVDIANSSMNASVEGNYHNYEAYLSEEDAFGNLNLKPFVIDDEYTLVFDGFDNEKADVGFGCTNQTDQYWEGGRDVSAGDPITPTFVIYSSNLNSQYRINSCNARIYFEGMFDVVNVVSGDSIIAPTAGGRCTFVSNGTTYVGPQFQSTLEWAPEGSRVANYQVEGMPEWLSVAQCITSNYTSDNGWINILDVTAEALPDGVAGRYAEFYIVSENGARSQVVKVTQGDITGINTVSTKEEATTNGAIYNLAGQRVGNDYKGVVIENGKKVIKK